MNTRLTSVALLLLSFGVAAFSTQSARADSLYVGGAVTWGQQYIFNGQSQNVGAGRFDGVITIGSGLPISLDAMYCIDITHHISLNSTYSGSLTEINTQGNVHNDPWLTASDADKIGYLMKTYSVGATTAAEQQALQGAIWTATYANYNALTYAGYSGANPGYTFVTSNSNVLSLYNSYLTDVNTANTTGYRHSVYWINGNNGGYAQAQVGYTMNEPTNSSAVPEPSSFALLGLGGLGMGFAAYRRRKLAV